MTVRLSTSAVFRIHTLFDLQQTRSSSQYKDVAAIEHKVNWGDTVKTDQPEPFPISS